MTPAKLQSRILLFCIFWTIVCMVYTVGAHGQTPPASTPEQKNANPHRFDGSDWVSWPQEKRTQYVFGMRAGMYLASYILWEKNLSANQHLNPLLDTIYTAETINRLNDFYSKPANRNTPIAVAWRILAKGALK